MLKEAIQSHALMRRPRNEHVIRAVVWDLGGVVLKQTMENFFPRFCSRANIPLKDFKKSWKVWKDSLLRGKRSVVDFCRYLEQKFEKGGLVKIWKECYRENEVNEEVVKLLNETKEYGLLAGLISNTVDLNAKINEERGVFELFDIVVLSCNVGFVKPEAQIFLKFLKSANLNADECIFVDDRRIHVKKAWEFGFRATLFDGKIEKLRKFVFTFVHQQ